ncbi:hypothetical protein O181_019297 [Austropuccinia psidii MF-1]|uniref:Uncharacterized protein n=1 Tax=Austropuccinia psidii MF-1 TaxID=1389203 RepID=A0A9Q3CB97_9BASI|nr:hypothetical protein [Austropuccinia psidii MF-1]
MPVSQHWHERSLDSHQHHEQRIPNLSLHLASSASPIPSNESTNAMNNNKPGKNTVLMASKDKFASFSTHNPNLSARHKASHTPSSQDQESPGHIIADRTAADINSSSHHYTALEQSTQVVAALLDQAERFEHPKHFNPSSNQPNPSFGTSISNLPGHATQLSGPSHKSSTRVSVPPQQLNAALSAKHLPEFTYTPSAVPLLDSSSLPTTKFTSINDGSQHFLSTPAKNYYSVLYSQSYSPAPPAEKLSGMTIKQVNEARPDNSPFKENKPHHTLFDQSQNYFIPSAEKTHDAMLNKPNSNFILADQQNDPDSIIPHLASSQCNETLSLAQCQARDPISDSHETEPFATCHNIIQSVETSAQDNTSVELPTHDLLVKETSLIVNLHTKPTLPEVPSTQEPINSPPSYEGKSRCNPHSHDLTDNVLILPYQESPTSDTSYSSMEAQSGTSLHHLEAVPSVSTSNDSAPSFLRSEESELFKTYSGPVSQGKDSQENLQEIVDTLGEFSEVTTQTSDECDSNLDSASLHAITNTSVLPEPNVNHSTFASIPTPCIKDDLPAKKEPVQIPFQPGTMPVEEPSSYLEHESVNRPQSPLPKGLHEAQDLFKKESTAAYSTIEAKPAEAPYCKPKIFAQGSKPPLQEASSSQDSSVVWPHFLNVREAQHSNLQSFSENKLVEDTVLSPQNFSMEGDAQLSNQRRSLADNKPAEDLPSAQSESPHSNQTLHLEQKCSHEGNKGVEEAFAAHLDYSDHITAQPTEQDPFTGSAILPKNPLHLNVAQVRDQKRSLEEDAVMYSPIDNQAAVCLKSDHMEEKADALGTSLEPSALPEAPPSSRQPPLLKEIKTYHDNPIKELPLLVTLGQLEPGHATDPQTSPVIAFEEPTAESLADLDPTVASEYTTDIPEDNAMDRPCKAIISEGPCKLMYDHKALRHQFEDAVDQPNSISNTSITTLSVESHAFQPSHTQVELPIRDDPEQIQAPDGILITEDNVASVQDSTSHQCNPSPDARLKSGESQELADSDYKVKEDTKVGKTEDQTFGVANLINDAQPIPRLSEAAEDPKAKLPIDLPAQSEQHQPTAPPVRQSSEVLLSRAVTSMETDHLHAVLPDQENQLVSATGDIHDDPLTERVASPEASFPLQNILVEQNQLQAQTVAGVDKEAPTFSGLVMLSQTSNPYEKPAKAEESAFNVVEEDHADRKISEVVALETMAEPESVAPTNTLIACTVSEGVTSSNYDRSPPKLSGEGVGSAKAVADINADKPTDETLTLQPVASPGTSMPKDTHTEQDQQPVASESSNSKVVTLLETGKSLDKPAEQSEEPVKAHTGVNEPYNTVSVSLPEAPTTNYARSELPQVQGQTVSVLNAGTPPEVAPVLHADKSRGPSCEQVGQPANAVEDFKADPSLHPLPDTTISDTVDSSECPMDVTLVEQDPHQIPLADSTSHTQTLTQTGKSFDMLAEAAEEPVTNVYGDLSNHVPPQLEQQNDDAVAKPKHKTSIQQLSGGTALEFETTSKADKPNQPPAEPVGQLEPSDTPSLEIASQPECAKPDSPIEQEQVLFSGTSSESAKPEEEPRKFTTDASENHATDDVTPCETSTPINVPIELEEQPALIVTHDEAKIPPQPSETTPEADKPHDKSAQPAGQLTIADADAEPSQSAPLSDTPALEIVALPESPLPDPPIEQEQVSFSGTTFESAKPKDEPVEPSNPTAESLSTGSLAEAATSTQTVTLSESETNSNVVVPNNQEKEGGDLVSSSCDPELNHEGSQEPAAALIQEFTIHTHDKEAVVSAVHVASTVAPSADGDSSSNLGAANSSEQTTEQPCEIQHGMREVNEADKSEHANTRSDPDQEPTAQQAAPATIVLPSDPAPLLGQATSQETSKEEALASAHLSSNQASSEQSDPQAQAPSVTNSEDTIHNIECVSIPTTESEVQPTISLDDAVPTYPFNYASTPAFLSTPPPSMLSIPKPPVNPTNISKYPPSLIVTNITREVILPPVMKPPSLISLKSSQSTFFQASESVVLICSSTLTPRSQHGEDNVNLPTAIPCVAASSSIQTQASLIVPQPTPKAELRPAASIPSRRKLVKRFTNDGYMSPTSAAAKTRILTKPKTRPISNFESQSAAKSLIPVLSRPISCRGHPDVNIAPIRSPKRVLKGVTLVDPTAPPALSTRSSAEGLIEVDSFTLIDKPNKAAHHDNNDFGSAKLRRRLTNSVKDMLQRRHSRTAKLASLSPALKEVPIANDFHFDVDRVMANVSAGHNNSEVGNLTANNN